ncbi:MAG: RND transporter, partial [Betaproteobacteria bacterium]
TLVEQKESIDGLVASSVDTVESFMRQFDAGRRSWLDVLNAERELFDARLARAQIDAGLLDAALRIHAGTGLLDGWALKP